jgi:hypothetical protein
MTSADLWSRETRKTGDQGAALSRPPFNYSATGKAPLLEDKKENPP